MISAIKAYIRKVKSTLFRKEIDASILDEICEAASPNLRSYQNFLSKHSSHINHSPPISRYIDLYKQSPSHACQEIKKMIQRYGDEETLKLFEVTFYRCSQNAIRLIMDNELENNIILNENISILIKNLDITENVSLEFNQFTQVSFIRNIFRKNADIRITNSIVTQGYFVKNQARENINVRFYNTSYIISTKNNYIANAIFNYQPLAFGLKHNPPLRFPTIMVFDCNKIFSLSIDDHTKEDEFDKTSMPIKRIEFIKGNKIEKLRIQTASNKMFNESLGGASSADIESIFFDTHENIGAIRDKGTPLFAFTESFFRELKKQATIKGDLLLENTYQRQEKIFLPARLYHLEDKFIPWWGRIASDTGISWKRPLGWLLLFQFILALTAYCLFAEYDPYLGEMCTPELKECTPYLDKGLIPFLGLFAWFMNPVSLLPPVAITMASGLIYILFLFQKLFSAVFYYEIVKVLRRFSR